MKGLITKRNGREYRIPGHLVLGLNIPQQKFLLEGTGYIFSFQRIKEGIEYEFTVAEFDEPSEPISEDNDFSEIDREYIKMREDEGWQLQCKLQEFRRLEAIVKEEGLID